MNSESQTPNISRIAGAPTVFVEGISQVMVGIPNSRILFHSSASAASGEEAEVRNIACELVMPTNSLVEAVILLSTHLSQVRDAISPASNTWASRLNQLLGALKPMDAPGLSVLSEVVEGPRR